MKVLPWIILALVISGWFIDRVWILDKKCQENIVQTVYIKGDSVPYLFKVYKPWLIVHKDTIFIDVPVVVDSAEVVKQFFTQYYYSDTITNDTSILAIINDTISQNKILSREVWLQNLRYKSIITSDPIVDIKEKPRFFIGGGILASKNFGFNISGAVELPNRSLISAGYDPVNNGILIAYYYRIR